MGVLVVAGLLRLGCSESGSLIKTDSVQGLSPRFHLGTREHTVSGGFHRKARWLSPHGLASLACGRLWGGGVKFVGLLRPPSPRLALPLLPLSSSNTPLLSLTSGVPGLQGVTPVLSTGHNTSFTLPQQGVLPSTLPEQPHSCSLENTRATFQSH